MTFEDFSETPEKKGGSGRGTVLAKACESHTVEAGESGQWHWRGVVES